MKCAGCAIITANILQLSLLGDCLYSLKGTRRGHFTSGKEVKTEMDLFEAPWQQKANCCTIFGKIATL